MGIGNDADAVRAEAGLQIRRNFVEVRVFLVLRLADDVIIIRQIADLQLRIIQLEAQPRNERYVAPLGQLVQRRVVYGKARNAGLPEFFQRLADVIAVVADHADDGVVIHSLLDRHRPFFHGVALDAHVYGAKEADEHGGNHQHVAVAMLFFHVSTLLNERPSGRV